MPADPHAAAPTLVRACGIELAAGRLVTTRVLAPGMDLTNINGIHVCPVHDADWPTAKPKPIGTCLVNYRAEGSGRG